VIVIATAVVGAAIATNSIMTAAGTRRCVEVEGKGGWGVGGILE